jgi:hypothetical protein
MDCTMTEQPSAAERFRKGIDEIIESSAAGLEEVVNTKAFGDALAQITGNLVAITRIGGETLDLVIRNAHLAGRRDITELGRQLARNEDKLEQVLVLVEKLEEELLEAPGDTEPEPVTHQISAKAPRTVKKAPTAKEAS